MISLHYSLAQSLEMILRLVIACACGAVVGFEREKNYKDAGLRTHLIVCCSAALMMLVSKYGFSDLYAAGEAVLGTKGADPSRIAAQVISGVSFIGAGVIFHNKNNTKGLTTASGLWAIAGVGIAIGAGMYEVGVFATFILLVIQNIVQKFPSNLGVVSIVSIEIVAKNSDEIRDRVMNYIHEHTFGISEQKVSIDGDIITYKVTVKMEENPTLESINSFFEDDTNIKSVSFNIMS